MAPTPNYPTAASTDPPAACHVMPEEVYWRRAYAAPGESTAFDRAQQTVAPAEVEWSAPKRVAS